MEIFPHTMKLSEEYTISYETIDSTVNIFLVIETDNGFLGYGCAAPDPAVTGETPDSVVKIFNDTIKPALTGENPLRYVYLLNNINEPLKSHPSAKAMVDMALYDIIGKVVQLPVYQFLGGYRHKIKTSITIGILPVSSTIEAAKKFVKQGFTALKIKGGTDVDLDIERMIKVRETVGPSIELRFDANQGYTVYESLKFAEEIKAVDISLIEQPTNKNKPDMLGRVTNNVDIPVMADESLLNLRDVFVLAKEGWVDTVNIKLMKVGGIYEALHINSVAKAANLGVMIGCVDESALGIAAGLHFALCRPNVLYADLDGHLALIDDPAAGGVLISDGYLLANTNYGIGVKPKL
jgi:L-alanine-DL-glutamate epimerase-like enolase superfamily enzyme